MIKNPPHDALRAAVNRAIANGSPIFENKPVSTFTLSIEAKESEKAVQYGFHLGTDEKLARQIIEEKMKARVANDIATVSLALMQNGKLIDVLYRDGTWHNP